MRETTIARNYAEALVALAGKAGDPDGWGAAINGVAMAIQADPRLHNFLAAPQVPSPAKIEVLGRAFAGRLPRPMIRFLQKLVMNRRHLLIPEIAVEYGTLVDEAAGRVHAQVTVAREATGEDRDLIAAELSRAFGREVIPHIQVNPQILGGVVVRVGDRVMDGSVRRRMATLRRRIVGAR